MTKRRQSLELPNAKHSAPIPMGARVGNMIFSSGIMGQNPTNGDLPDDPALQARYAFQNMKALVEAGGGTLDDIGRITVFIKDNSMRAHVNTQWAEYFPDEHSRPARHAIVLDLPGGMLVQLEIVAVVPDAGQET